MQNKVIVTVKEGKISGVKKQSSFSGAEYYSFLGVPYGQSTAGAARFKDPVKVKPWKNTLDATTEKDGCVQFSMQFQKILGSEDCLYNNIFTPSLPSEKSPLRKVIYNIHPGGYVDGSPDPSAFGSPDYVMHHDIVYVGVSFRLHVLGFLNLNLKECSGNQGLKDIIMSLEWVKENISAFGGDPNDITIMGSSSGAALVHLLMLSPRAKGLFHKAIIMGLYNFNPTIITFPENATLALEMAKSLDYDYEETSELNCKKLLSFYKKVSIDDVIVQQRLFAINVCKVQIFPNPVFAPTTDQGPNSVLPENIENLIDSMHRIPLLVGFCDKEAILGFIRKEKSKTMKYFYSTVQQNRSGWGRHLNKNDLKYIQEKAELFYANGNSLETMNLTTKCDIQTDIGMSDLYDSIINVIAADLPSSVYVYKFDFEGNMATMKDKISPMLDEPLQGTFHGSDYCYWALMEEHWTKKSDSLTPRTKQMIETFTKIISTFAKTGNPNYDGIPTKWEPSSIENPCYLRIDDSIELIEGKLNGKRTEFWESLKQEFTLKMKPV